LTHLLNHYLVAVSDVPKLLNTKVCHCM